MFFFITTLTLLSKGISEASVQKRTFKFKKQWHLPPFFKETTVLNALSLGFLPSVLGQNMQQMPKKCLAPVRQQSAQTHLYYTSAFQLFNLHALYFLYQHCSITPVCLNFFVSTKYRGNINTWQPNTWAFIMTPQISALLCSVGQ